MASSSSSPAVAFPRRVDVGDVPEQVRAQVDDDAIQVEEVAPGVFVRASDGLLLGSCAAVRPYAAAHGKPGGFLCY